MSSVHGTLFHFTKKLPNLKAILNEGFWPRYVFESDIWPPQTARSASHIGIPMVCFCDIPLHQLAVHVGDYGKYGIGMTQQWAVRAGLNPVAYVNTGGWFRDQLLNLGRATGLNSWRSAAAFLKPLEGIEERRGAHRHKLFYEESEWRHVPNHPQIQPTIYVPDHVRQGNPEVAAQTLNAANLETKQHCLLAFKPGDVRYIIVRSDAQIPRAIELVSRSRLAMQNPGDTNYLLSCVTSYESIARDA